MDANGNLNKILRIANLSKTLCSLMFVNNFHNFDLQ
jgi:hypothetical protein